MYPPCLNENLLCPVRSTGGGGGAYVGCEFFKPMLRIDGHSSKSVGSMHSLWAWSQSLRSTVHGLVLWSVMMAKVHGEILCL